MFDPATGTAVTVSDAAAEYPFAPAFDGSVVVWEDHRNGYSDIYARRFDRATGQPTGDAFPVCTAPGHQTNPAIDGDTVVWQDSRSGGWDIYAYDLTDQREYAGLHRAGGPDEPRRERRPRGVAGQPPRPVGHLLLRPHEGRGVADLPLAPRADAAGRVQRAHRLAGQPPAPGSRSTNLPPQRYLAPHIWAYSVPAHRELDEIWGGIYDNRETLPDISGRTVVYEDTAKQAADTTRISGVRTNGVWAYGYSICRRLVREHWELTFDVQVDSCPTPPVAEIGMGDKHPGRWQGDS